MNANVIAKLDTHQGFSLSFRDKELSKKTQQDNHSDGLWVNNELFAKLTKDHPDYAQYVEARAHLEAVMRPRAIRAKAGAVHRDLTLPTGTKGEGWLAQSLHAAYDQQLATLHADLVAARPLAKVALPIAMQYARTRKNGTFRAEKYPTVEDIDEIDFDWWYEDAAKSSSQALIKAVETLGEQRAEELKVQIADRERSRLVSGVEVALTRTVGALSDLSEMLANPEAKMMSANLGNAIESAAVAKSQMHDLLGDSEVDGLFDQVIAYLNGVSLDDLKRDNSQRCQAAKDLVETVQAFGAIGMRKFNL